jgi:hypothetical protein
MPIKPVSIVAFVLALLALVLMLTALVLPRWYLLYRPGSGLEAWYGLWHQQTCWASDCSEYIEFTKIEGGKGKVLYIFTFALFLVTIRRYECIYRHYTTLHADGLLL